MPADAPPGRSQAVAVMAKSTPVPPTPAASGGEARAREEARPGRFQHEPVLLEGVLGLVPPAPTLLVDCTLGGGGHAAALLERFPQAELFGADRDTEALAAARERLAPYAGRTLLKHLPFSEIGSHLLAGSVDFLLADLGVSSPQLDHAGRGFSFTAEGPLDMRMDPGRTRRTAAEIVNSWKPDALRRLFQTYGEERFAPRIVQAIEQARREGPIETTTALARIVSGAVPAKFHRRGRHPATKVFQALRIEVNDELGELERLLDAVLPLLKPGGRVAVIAFHSLEDRLVKGRFRTWEQPCTCPPGLPVCACGREPEGRRVTRKPIVADAAETARNPRSRSARLRAFEKRGAPAAEPEEGSP